MYLRISRACVRFQPLNFRPSVFLLPSYHSYHFAIERRLYSDKMGSLPEQCCTLPPFKSSYKPVGKRITLKVDGRPDMELYVTGPPGGSTAIVGLFDIFGFHNNTLQGADYLAKKGGYTVVIPDFFRGETWDVDNMPPKEGRPFLNAWVQARGSYDKVLPDLSSTIKYLKGEGKTTIGAYGLCFGAKKIAQAAHLELFRAVVCAHPSFFQPEDADFITVPLALLPSSGEDKDVMNGFWERMMKKPFADKCYRENFHDVNHGFASARANYDDPRLAQRARDAYDIMAKFFGERL